MGLFLPPPGSVLVVAPVGDGTVLLLGRRGETLGERKTQYARAECRIGEPGVTQGFARVVAALGAVLPAALTSVRFGRGTLLASVAYARGGVFSPVGLFDT